jgi:hypothetical protein
MRALVLALLAVSSVVAQNDAEKQDEKAVMEHLGEHSIKDDPRMSKKKWRNEMKGAYVFVCKQAGDACVKAIESDNAGQVGAA